MIREWPYLCDSDVPVKAVRCQCRIFDTTPPGHRSGCACLTCGRRAEDTYTLRPALDPERAALELGQALGYGQAKAHPLRLFLAGHPDLLGFLAAGRRQHDQGPGADAGARQVARFPIRARLRPLASNFTRKPPPRGPADVRERAGPQDFRCGCPPNLALT